MSECDYPDLNNWIEVVLRKVIGNEFHSGTVHGKKEDL